MDKIFKALADRNRRKILTLLKDKEMSVYGILSYLEIKQATLSNHLAILRKANLVSCQIKGKQRIYRLNREVLLAFTENLNKFTGTIRQSLTEDINIRTRSQQ